MSIRSLTARAGSTPVFLLLLTLPAISIPLCDDGVAHARPIVALLTDFGLENEAVGLCHAAILRHDSEIEVLDLCHNVTAYDVPLAALMLRGSSLLPSGAAVVGVVDPGVGTARRAIAVRTGAGITYVGPDNGIFSWVLADQGATEAVELDPSRINPDWSPGTFDGRDLFSPAAALIVKPGGTLATVGRPIDPASLQRLETPRARAFREPDGRMASLGGVVLREDRPYGNLWTNITRDELADVGIALGGEITVTFLAGADAADAQPLQLSVPFVVTFGQVAKGKPLAYIGSAGTLSFAINLGSFRETYGLAEGSQVEIRRPAR
ncbi:MAG: SAM-dependent chlorinase/fluorinase [Candidatus Eisenbacteria bacterium]|nr:SAM-dependent chlorinase/fluorinase [Candidatus Eisenbacteria bacterium]